LLACLCRRYAKETELGNWGIASEDDCESIVATLLQPKDNEESEDEEEQTSSKGTTLQSLDSVSGSGSNTRSSSRLKSAASKVSSSSSSSSSKGEKPKPPDKNMIRYFRKSISNMKNFVESTHRYVVYTTSDNPSGLSRFCAEQTPSGPDTVPLKLFSMSCSPCAPWGHGAAGRNQCWLQAHLVGVEVSRKRRDGCSRISSLPTPLLVLALVQSFN
jgi:hypothetical protein